MKKTTFLILIFLMSFGVFSQEDYESKPNVVKTNVTSWVFRNFEFQYERVFNKTISGNINFGFIPKGKVPMLGVVEKYIDDPETMDYLKDLKIAQTNVIAEVRFYLGKGYGKGFYLAPFYDYTSYSVDNFKIEYQDDHSVTQHIAAKGSVGASTFGLLIGTQFDLGHNIVLDWWILGPHYGFASGDVSGHSTRSFSTDEQAKIKKEIEKLNIPMVNVKAEVSSNDAKVKLDGPFGGLRGGLSVGYRF